MPYTVPPITLDYSQAVTYDLNALRVRLMAFVKNDPTVINQATYDAAIVTAQAAVDAMTVLEDADVAAIQAQVDIMSAVGADIATVSAAKAAITAIVDAKLAAGDAFAVAQNATWNS